jgi:hypothetical protein
LESCLVLSFTEMNTRDQIDDLVATLAGLNPEVGSNAREALSGSVS